MARILVIGGTLFIGRAIVERLIARGDDVVIMHRGASTPFGSRVDRIQCDRNDMAAVRAALEGRHFDIVFDNVYDWQRGTSAEQVNAAALAAANGLGRYVFMSSVAVYPPGGEYDEDAVLVADDVPNPYAAQKAASERALFALHDTGRVPVTTVRPAFVYGPHNPFEREAFFWDRILAGRPVIIPGDGTSTMQWVHVHDVAQAAIAAAEAPAAGGHAYNLAGPPITQSAFVELLARIAGREPKLAHVPRERIAAAGGSLLAPPYYFGAYLDVPPITVRADRVRAELGVQLMSLEDGLADTFGWYREQTRPRPDFSWEDELLSSAHVR
jgi:2'-hydroxyisoflavone reductase